MSASSDSKETSGSSRLKQLTSSSTWTSPFRSGNRKNVIQQLKDKNDVSSIPLPKKFATHPTLEAEKAKAEKAKAEAAIKEVKEGDDEDAEGAEQTEATENAEQTEQTEETEQTENVEEAAAAAAAEPVDEVAAVNEANHSTAVDVPEATEGTAQATEPAEASEVVKPTDDNIEQQVKETAIELDVPDKDKYAPIKPPNQEILDSLQDKPNLLNRYQELNAAAVGLIAKSLDDPNKVVDLGGGLKLTQQQLLDIAAKRVAPVIENINQEVAKTREEDRILYKQQVDNKAAKHHFKLRSLFEKHVAKLEKQKGNVILDIDAQMTQLDTHKAAAITSHEDFKTSHAENVETANTNFAQREEKAREQHEVDKENLLKNHDELEATKKQDLQNAKDEQVTVAAEIEELKEKKISTSAHNDELDQEIDALTKQLEERENDLQAVKDKLYSERIAVDAHEERKKELNGKLTAASAEVESKRSHKGKLALEVGALATAVAAYSAHLTTLRTEKEQVPSKISAAKEKYNSWVEEKKELAAQLARDHEQQRLEAKEAAATEEYKNRLEEEKKQLEEEMQRHLEEKEKFQNDLQKESDEEEAKKGSSHANKAAIAAAAVGTAATAGAAGVAAGVGHAGASGASASKSVLSSLTGHGKSAKPAVEKDLETQLPAVSKSVAAEGAAANAALERPKSERRQSIRKKFKNLIGISGSKTEEREHAPEDSDVYSLYEEVDDDEFAQHQDDPNYIEVDSEVAEKLLKKNRG